MRSFVILTLALGLVGCQERATPQTPTDPMSQDEAAPAIVAEPVALEDRDLVRVCKAGAAFRAARSVEGIKAKVTGAHQVRLSYTRDDGKRFQYDCLVETDVIRFRMIDEAGPGTGPGNWSGRGSRVTFKVASNSIEITETIGGGKSSGSFDL